MKCTKHLRNRPAGLLLVLGMVVLAALIPRAYAQDALPSCDPQLMDAIETKAWLGVQRRITQNKNIIFKPDSVLEYSCFNQHLTTLASNPSGRRFSENFPPYPLWQEGGPIAGIDVNSLDRALFEVVGAPLVAYLGENFGHTFMGGRTIDAEGQDPAGEQYNCEAMAYVWTLARCKNFEEDREDLYVLGDDAWYDFPWYATNDPRRIPAEYTACTPPGIVMDAIIESHRATSADTPPPSVNGQNLDDSGLEYSLFVLEEENNPAIDDDPYEEDPMTVEEITDKMIPGECGESLLIPTGVTVAIPRIDPFMENVCLTPACSFDGGECVN